MAAARIVSFRPSSDLRLTTFKYIGSDFPPRAAGVTEDLLDWPELFALLPALPAPWAQGATSARAWVANAAPGGLSRLTGLRTRSWNFYDAFRSGKTLI